MSFNEKLLVITLRKVKAKKNFQRSIFDNAQSSSMQCMTVEITRFFEKHKAMGFVDMQEK